MNTFQSIRNQIDLRNRMGFFVLATSALVEALIVITQHVQP